MSDAFSRIAESSQTSLLGTSFSKSAIPLENLSLESGNAELEAEREFGLVQEPDSFISTNNRVNETNEDINSGPDSVNSATLTPTIISTPSTDTDSNDLRPTRRGISEKVNKGLRQLRGKVDSIIESKSRWGAGSTGGFSLGNLAPLFSERSSVRDHGLDRILVKLNERSKVEDERLRQPKEVLLIDEPAAADLPLLNDLLGTLDRCKISSGLLDVVTESAIFRELETRFLRPLVHGRFLIPHLGLNIH